jgi:hypothetical protein
MAIYERHTEILHQATSIVKKCPKATPRKLKADLFLVVGKQLLK